MDAYEASGSITSELGQHEQRALNSCNILFQGARSTSDLLLALRHHAMQATGTSIYLGDILNLMHNTGAERFLPPVLARPEHARHCSGNLQTCYTTPRDLELFAKWACGGDLTLASEMIETGVSNPESVNKQKHGLSAFRHPVNSPSLAEVGLSSGRPGIPEAVGDFVPHSVAQFSSDDSVAHRAQSSQDGNSQAFDETLGESEGSSINHEPAASGGASEKNDAASPAASRTGRKAQNLLVLRASLGNEPRTYVMGMQCVCAYLGRAPNDPLPLDGEITPLLRSLPSKNLLSLGKFVKIELPHGGWSASVRSAQVVPRLASGLATLCNAYRDWFADEPEEVTRVVIDLGGGVVMTRPHLRRNQSRHLQTTGWSGVGRRRCHRPSQNPSRISASK